ncbi:uncharacterized protein LOC100824248 [Brachypodium distachyon]|uniref:PGG domain-containing protein n=1 Tax=Brachypodium distachyon TaxID=15368 RepID=I1GYY5_BRADI|nr:uncharacterized protein LOC100824248 [Brachypodium distachyon]PNT76043.1 hypothetical protein BRADI_1g43300v3 [Brachypodium distachyon]PNT76044.1 hypothetical protein BRADI_1g43300v3 [Brachypodium distachyon]|eukprot:XP_014757524.1 uncharacterized protein LOC100824248 [Brachypodium distachyon]
MAAANIENMESSSRETAAPPQNEPSWEYHLRKYLMLLATLVATATYAAGLSPPGGIWEENKTVTGEKPQDAGVPILYHSARYLAFFYFNATAFMASLVVNLLLLVLSKKRKTVWLAVLRFVMVLDLLGLIGAYATGSCRDLPTTVYASTLVVALAAYVGIHILLARYAPLEQKSEQSSQVDQESPDEALKRKEQRKVLLLLATFATGISYAAGLSPPGGFRDDDVAGDPTLQAQQSPRLLAFFYCNTTAFVASLLVIVLLLGRRLQRCCAQVQLYGFILVALLGLLGAYAAGSSWEPDTMAYIVALVAAVPTYIFLVMVIMVLVSNPLKNSTSWSRLQSMSARASHWLQERGCHQNQTDGEGDCSPSPGSHTNEVDTSSNRNEGIEKAKSLILLLATLAATITYQAGMDPPGGVWQANDQDRRYKAGDPILLWKHAARYKVFFYCNSTAFVASLVVILMVQNRSLVRGHALEVAMILDLFGLIGAYAAGSCRELSTSIYVMALAGAVLVYVVIHVVFFTLHTEELNDEEKRKIDKRRKRLLLLAILVATITYQAGLTPPGGFWTKSAHGEPGSPILEDQGGEYQRRYKAFFYCNSTSFMASMALIIMLVNPNLYRPGIQCYALYVCMVVALFGLMGAYAAGSARELRTSIYVFVLVGAVVAFIVIQLIVFFKFCANHNPNGDNGSSSGSSAGGSSKAKDSSSSSKPMPSSSTEESSRRRKYLMLLAILAASVTYQAGLKPPGSTWEESLPGVYVEGDPVMHHTNQARYHAFFYCNSTSFVASVVVIVLLLQESLQNHKWLLRAMNTAIVLDLLGLLGAYAAGSTREWDTSGYVITLVAAVVAYVGIHLVLWFLSGWRGQGRVNSS